MPATSNTTAQNNTSHPPLLPHLPPPHTCSSSSDLHAPTYTDPAAQQIQADDRFWLTDSNTPLDSSPDSAAILLLRWMRQHAALHSSVTITSHSAGGLGMRALADVPRAY